jgi:uncharacterized protein (DUF2147 family)
MSVLTLPTILPLARGKSLVLLASVLGLSLPSDIAAADVAGVWLTQAGDAKIQISRCGPGICGRIVWLKEPIDRATSKPQVDDKNPNPALTTRRILGLSILSNMKSRGDKDWAGRIYNADDGKTYDATISLQDENALKVRGCVGPLCGSETWSRANGR